MNKLVPGLHNISSYYQLSLQVETKPHKKLAPDSKTRYIANVNIMHASVYKLVFHDPELQKLAPSKLEIDTYSPNMVKMVGSCVFYLVHLDAKHLQEVIFYVASNNGSVLLSSVTTLARSLKQHCTRLDYLPPRNSLITGSADHPKKKSQIMYMYQSKNLQNLTKTV